jgi:hypothetical protein
MIMDKGKPSSGHRTREDSSGRSNPEDAFDLTLPDWKGQAPRDDLYNYAIKQILLLSRLAPDDRLRFDAARFLVGEFKPLVQILPQEEARRSVALEKIENILRARGIEPPAEAPLTFELKRKGVFLEQEGAETEAGDGDDFEKED